MDLASTLRTIQENASRHSLAAADRLDAYVEFLNTDLSGVEGGKPFEGDPAGERPLSKLGSRLLGRVFLIFSYEGWVSTTGWNLMDLQKAMAKTLTDAQTPQRCAEDWTFKLREGLWIREFEFPSERFNRGGRKLLVETLSKQQVSKLGFDPKSALRFNRPFKFLEVLIGGKYTPIYVAEDFRTQVMANLMEDMRRYGPRMLGRCEARYFQRGRGVRSENQEGCECGKWFLRLKGRSAFCSPVCRKREAQRKWRKSKDGFGGKDNGRVSKGK